MARKSTKPKESAASAEVNSSAIEEAVITSASNTQPEAVPAKTRRKIIPAKLTNGLKNQVNRKLVIGGVVTLLLLVVVILGVAGVYLATKAISTTQANQHLGSIYQTISNIQSAEFKLNTVMKLTVKFVSYGGLEQSTDSKASGSGAFDLAAKKMSLALQSEAAGQVNKAQQVIDSENLYLKIEGVDEKFRKISLAEYSKAIFPDRKDVPTFEEWLKLQVWDNSQYKDASFTFVEEDTVDGVAAFKYKINIGDQSYKDYLDSAMISDLVAGYQQSGIDVTKEDVTTEFSAPTTYVWLSKDGTQALKAQIQIPQGKVSIKDIIDVSISGLEFSINYAKINQSVSVEVPKV